MWTRINVTLGAVLACALLLAGYSCWRILETKARREVLAEAGLMMDSALAMRTYTANEIVPLLEPQIRSSFPPQSVPFYAATQSFLKLRARHPEYMYKEATLNPTNPRDRAAMRGVARIAERLSVGDASGPDFPRRGASELLSLGRSFNRMLVSRKTAMRLLEP